VQEILTPLGSKVLLPTRLVEKLGIQTPIFFNLSTRNSDLERCQVIVSDAEKLGTTRAGHDAYLRAALLFRDLNEFEQMLLACGNAMLIDALLLANDAEIGTALSSTAETLRLFNQCLPTIAPYWNNEWIQVMDSLGQFALSLIGRLSFDYVSDRSEQIIEAISILVPVWETEFGPHLKFLVSIIEQLDRIALNEVFVLRRQVIQERRAVESIRSHGWRARQHQRTLTEALDELAESLVEYARLLTNAREHTSLSFSELPRTVQGLVGEVEIGLRSLIASRYSQKYGNRWIQHIQTIHKNEYAYWVRNIPKNQGSLEKSKVTPSRLLQYSRLSDLQALILAEWHLFQPSFDFGQKQHNELIFRDRMRTIIDVRNALAHNRDTAENDLLRALAFCRDLISILSQTGYQHLDT